MVAAFFFPTGLLIFKGDQQLGNVCIKMLQQLYIFHTTTSCFQTYYKLFTLPFGSVCNGRRTELSAVGYTLTSTQVVVKRLLAAGKEGENKGVTSSSYSLRGFVNCEQVIRQLVTLQGGRN